MSGILNDEDVSVEKVESLFKAAFLRAERDQNGELLVKDDSGVTTLVRVNTGNKMITFFSVWGLKSDFTEESKLKLVNKLNEKLALVRFTMLNPSTMSCDYQVLYEQGVTPFHIINTYRVFASMTKGATLFDSENMLGTD